MSKYPVVYVVADRPEVFAELIPGALGLGERVEAILAGHPANASGVFSLGADKLLTIAPREREIFENYAPSIAKAISATPNALVLLAADKRGKAMAAKLGKALNAAVINDVNTFDEGKSGHMVYGGLAQGTEKPATDIVVTTVAPGAFEQGELGEGSGETVALDFIEPAHPITLREKRKLKASSVNIGKARRVVGVGRGFAKKEDLALARALADAIGAELACSRPIAEGEHWLERERYVGVSGVAIKPEVYFTLGISGQIQHMVGARDSRTIIVVNKDKNAPIFKFADYGIIGDLYKILPALKKALGK